MFYIINKGMNIMSLRYSDDNGADVLKYAAKASTKFFDYVFLVGDLCDSIRNNSILIIRNTSDESMIANGKMDLKYFVKDFEIKEDSKLGDTISLKLQDETSKNLVDYTVKHIKNIEQNIGKKYYITSDNLKDDVLGFIFR